MSTPSSTQWHSITPQTRPLTLSILELTPLALTLALTLAPISSNHPSTPGSGRKKKYQRRRESDDEGVTDDDHANTSSSLPGSWPNLLGEGTSFKDILSHGVVVSVNGQPWNRIVAHVSDDDGDDVPLDAEGDAAEGEEAWSDMERAGEENDSGSGGEEGGVTRRRPRRARFRLSAGNAVKGEKEVRKRSGKECKSGEKDRAVVVVYGLSPGKEYEIELKVVGLSGEDSLVSNAIVIPPSPSPHTSLLPRSRANSLRSRSRPRSRSNSINASHPGHPPSPLGQDLISAAITPPSNGDLSSATVFVPVDSQAAQLQHLIATAQAEKDILQAQIKEARRSSQRAEAALRLEIESVKKAIEKAGGMDMRAKQKALALQEQVKQGWAGAESAEAETTAVDEGLAELEARLEGVLQEVEIVRNEWKDVKDKEEEVREREKKMRGEEDKKLVEVVAKMDKLRVRKEKKEAERAELEKRLEELEKAREEAERRNEEERNLRRSTGPHQANHGRWDEWHGAEHGRSLSAHPSLSNLSGQYAAGPAYRPRGAPGYQPRFPSAGTSRAPTAGGAAQPQPSPTHSHAFYPLQHPVPPSGSNTSPALRAPVPGRGVGGGTNIAALPFHPLHHDAQQQQQQHHTALMPPQLQHRIYLPHHTHHTRPRPAPTFHPPPSVLAEQQQHQHQHNQHQHQHQQQQQTSLAAPAFPPLPSQNQTGNNNNSNNNTSGSGNGKGSLNSISSTSASGPSLASIVTRAVLSPTSALVQNTSSTPIIPTSPTPNSNSTSTSTPHSNNSISLSTPTSTPTTKIKFSPPTISPSPTPPPPPPPSNFTSTSTSTTTTTTPWESREFPALGGISPWTNINILPTRSTTPNSWLNAAQTQTQNQNQNQNQAGQGRESPAGVGGGSSSVGGRKTTGESYIS
ncbi:hypothetical protein BCR39DRAFT_530126 [Naematelia encephala]|uniref:Fibronectin type-III domain-containing protein n=1 Tax=Naematelia encephala TaxID=71784 RepID=A0A1Y2B5W8_9TREE|nr:hypothetical protein BCR39DRAFT_530126 [Naematelia encephala]